MLFYIGSVLCIARACKAEQFEDANGDVRLSGPYCGLYAAYAAAHACHVDVRADAVRSMDYISSPKGSTPEDIARLLQSIRLHAVIVTGWNSRGIAELKVPFVAHIMSVPGSGKYDHYACVASHNASGVSLVDPMLGYRRLSWQEFSALWDGAGVVVSDKEIALGRALAASRIADWAEAGAILVVPVIATGVASLTVRRIRGRLRGPATLAVSVMLSVGVFAASGSTVISSAYLRSLVLQHYSPQFVRPASVSDARSAQSEVVFIDARMERDYQSAHIPGALNLGVRIGRSKRAVILSNVPKDRKIIVYCEQRTCDFAGIVAARLCGDGFVNVSTMPEGWEGRRRATHETEVNR